MTATIDRARAVLGAAGAAALGGLGALAAYGLAVRPWHLAWRATAEEAEQPLPGDELLAAPTMVSTRAATIAAPPDEVWRWLVQMGRGRGGLYSYDRLENLVGLDIHSVDEIVPELQHLEVGDRMDLSAERFGLIARRIEPPEALVWEFADGGWIWAFHLRRTVDGGTRLLVRNRWTSSWAGPGWKVALWAVEPVAFVMEQRMLRGIVERAERAHREDGRWT